MADSMVVVRRRVISSRSSRLDIERASVRIACTQSWRSRKNVRSTARRTRSRSGLKSSATRNMKPAENHGDRLRSAWASSALAPASSSA
jgi:hypothetical protein